MRRTLGRAWLCLSIAILLALPLAWRLGRGVARGGFVLTPGGRFAAVAAQRFDVMLYFSQFDMGQFRLQPLIVQTGAIPHYYADYNIGFDARFHPHNYTALGAQLLIASSRDYRGSPAFAFVKVPLWIPLIVALPAPAIVARRGLVLRARRKRQLCIACGYDLRASPARCPECGAAVTARGTAAPGVV